MQEVCKCCEQPKDLRLGVCFDCADAESVIADGVDMWDEEIPKLDGMSIHLSKLKYILKKFKVVKPI